MFTHSHGQRWKAFSGAVLFLAIVMVLLFSYTAKTQAKPFFATLPPTWTPAPTRTTIPTLTPTITPSPTLSLTPSPTFTVEETCQFFRLTGSPVEGAHIDYASSIGFSWEYAPVDSIVALSLVPAAGGDEVLIAYLPYEGFNAIFSLQQLSGWGEYQWTISVVKQIEGEMCAVSGTFIRDPWWIEPLNNPLAPPFAH